MFIKNEKLNLFGIVFRSNLIIFCPNISFDMFVKLSKCCVSQSVDQSVGQSVVSWSVDRPDGLGFVFIYRLSVCGTTAIRPIEVQRCQTVSRSVSQSVSQAVVQRSIDCCLTSSFQLIVV
eukprot:Selendium_serpulae@DN9074_c0_g1_i1.p1